MCKRGVMIFSNMNNFGISLITNSIKERTTKLNYTLSGSFNKNFSEIIDYYIELKKYDFQLQSPRNFEILDDSTNFILLKGDRGNNIKEIEFDHLHAIKNSDILIVVNPKNYIGISTALEIGFAFENRIPIYFSHDIPKFLREKNKEDSKNNLKLFYITNHIDDKENNLVPIENNYDNLKSSQSSVYILDNMTKLINISIAFIIGRLIANKAQIFCLTCPKDILLKELLYISPKFVDSDLFLFQLRQNHQTQIVRTAIY